MRSLYLLMLFSIISLSADAQTASYNFRRVSSKDGLADGVVAPIGRDKYGYIWFGSLSGLNRYDGYRVTNFFHNSKDSFSVPTQFVHTIFGDKYGDIYFGYRAGLYRFDYPTNRFELVQGSKGVTVNEIRPAGDSLMLLTEKGIAFYNSVAKRFSFAGSANNDPMVKVPMYEGYVYGKEAYIATMKGILVYNTVSRISKMLYLKPGKEIPVFKVAIDSSGVVWACRNEKGALLYKGKENNTSFEEIRSHYYNKNGLIDRIIDIQVDRSNRLWLGTIWNGLVNVNTKDNSFTSVTNDSRIANSLPENHVTRIFTDEQGFLWLGTEGSGAAYFQPDYNLFNIFFPEPLKYARPHIWCRTIAEDLQGNLWMGTGTGLVKQSADGRKSELFQQKENAADKVIHDNSIRSLLCDDEGNMWIGTSAGVNLYENATKRIRFFSYEDSLPNYFYWQIMQDKKKVIWFASSGGLFYKTPGEYKFNSLHQHPALKKYARYGARSVLEDKRGNLWVGLNGRGLLMYDDTKKTARYWEKPGAADNPLGNMVTSIVEDNKGQIWFSTYFGVASYDYSTDKFTSYADVSVMGSLQISGLKVDKEDRLWLATARGLLMLDKDRKVFKRFDVEDGLPDIQFNDQTSYTMKNGWFVYPTYDGFVSFDPLKYNEKNISSNIIISSFSIPDNPSPRLLDATDKNEIELAASQDFFTIELTAFNYSNPRETWYAYKLDGFDKDWRYTRNRQANYTNVPGGKYVFRYKASSDPKNWNTEEKTLTININTVFYKTWIFRIGFILSLLALLFFVYRYRISQREKLLRLESKSQLLEKEKAQIMYDNLKQQLNPHFLFNSLTSLSSLIRVNPSLAGEFLESLSKTYRYILKSRDSEIVPLVSEIRFAETYVRLQQTRFEKGLIVNFNVPEEFFHRKIAPVTLQNMIENAIKHNIIDEESPLVIDIFIEDDYIIVKNNLQRKNFVETSNRQGLNNLQSLYHYLSEKSVLVVEEKDHFIVKIPLL
ncbi:histidine kinase [Terrimonas sp. NA20]|uniref:Histidine kinase n=1 Tax=Terrimonas ginsenosidimutans TaxID=2908004 RepID=A0ABS9KLB2_9BACT|nr:sensor histidine kinase [Terrimonas ginsenosidimutans]MCG2613113.1 histidine kinase [Terrimonas ginsenosidimutans]